MMEPLTLITLWKMSMLMDPLPEYYKKDCFTLIAIWKQEQKATWELSVLSWETIQDRNWMMH